ncbi:MAG: VWA domain-containing protein [Acidobacteriota bacterium]|nr:VWA domain-containing protein [Acidobacteriota bacterium]
MNPFNLKNLFFAVAVLLLFSTFAFAQDDDVIKIDTDLATFDVTVTDASGKPVRGLTAKDFRIFEDGVEREVEFFEQTQRANGARPIAVVFALDVSGSVTAEEIENLRRATNVFIDRLADKTATFALISFGMNVKRIQEFTNDKRKIERGFEKLLRDENGLSTHAYDAVDDAVRLLARKAPRTKGQLPVKKSVIVVTDGFPVGDIVSPATVIERAQAAEVSIFTVTLPSFTKISLSKNRTPLPTPLDVSGLAEKTGGKSVYATDKDFEPLFRSLAEDVTASYLLAFYPTEEKRHDGRFHTVKIEARNPSFAVRQNRNGYQSTPK